MNVYSIVLYVHIVGALGLFVALGLEWTALARLRGAATAEEARGALGALAPTRVIGPLSLAAILVAGLYLTATSVGWQGWNVSSLAAMVVIAALGAAANASRMPALGRSIGPLRGPLDVALRARLRDPLLWSSIQVRVAIALGIVLLMTAKPDVVGAIVTLVAFAVAGAVAAFATSRPSATSLEPRGLGSAS